MHDLGDRETLLDLLDNSHDLIQSVAPDGKLLYVNRRWLEVLGYDRDDLDALDVFDLIHPEDQPHCQGMFERLMGGEDVGVVEVRFVTKGGTTLWLQGSVNTRFEDGEPVATRGIFRDVTEQRMRTEALRASEEHLQFLADHMPVGIFQTTDEGQCTFVNRRWTELAGWPAEEALGEGWAQVIHPDDVSRIHEKWFEAVENRREFSEEMRFRSPEGRDRWVLGRGCRVDGENGDPPGYVGAVLDIEELKRLRHELEQSERKHRHLIESSLGLICSHDLEGRILAANPAGARALGYEPEELVGRSLLDFLAPDVTGELGEYLGRIHESQDDVGFVRVRTRSGDERVWLYRNSVYEENGVPQYVVGHAHDVTDLKKAEEDLRRQTVTDDLTGLTNRRGFGRRLERELEAARRAGRPIALLLVHLDGFEMVNQRFGRPAGDHVLTEVARRLDEAEPMAHWCRYGGAAFARLMRHDRVHEDSVRAIGSAVCRRLTEPFLGGDLQLTATVGASLWSPDGGAPAEPLTLTRRAEVALQRSRGLGGDAVVVWSPAVEAAEADHRDRLAGLFTANVAKDYRNMLLLWRTMMAVTGDAEVPEITREVLEGLSVSFRPDRVGLFRPGENDEPLLVQALEGGEEISSWDSSPEQTALLHRACDRGGLQRAQRRGPGGDLLSAYAVSLRADDQMLGCIYFEGAAGTLELDDGDELLVEKLVHQLAELFVRAGRREEEKHRLTTEHRRLEMELEELSRAVERSNLVYRSPAMEEVLASARRVAASDATVLVGGASGTGKEVLARTVHELSPRRGRPAVVVDLAAISSTLIESELFGHVKGAFTGADKDREGRLAEADGSTVILDEIGEMPLSVQAKLLRFVQEREVVAVGGHKVRKVDTRVIAVTNRDLAKEVAEGRFREDLYYRLNVVHLRIPPLEKRPEDVLALADHFLERHGGKRSGGAQGGGFTPEARAALLAYSWPGNARELQNKVLRAVVLGEGDRIGVEDLDLPVAPEVTPASPVSGRLVDTELLDRLTERNGEAPTTGGPLLPRLRDAVGELVDEVLEAGGRRPVGTWIDDQITLTAVDLEGSLRAAAQKLGLPHSTLRRRHDRALSRREAGMTPEAEAWPRIERLLTDLVTDGPGNGNGAAATPIPEMAHQAVLREISRRLPDETREAAALAGVTPPTYRRRLESLRAAS